MKFSTEYPREFKSRAEVRRFEANVSEEFRNFEMLAAIGAAVMVQAFVQWAAYKCKACGMLDNGECFKYNLNATCINRAFYDNFLSMKE